MPRSLTPGDAVAVPFWWGHHEGVVVDCDHDGEPLVAHCSRRVGYAAVERISKFASSKVVRRSRLSSTLSRAAIVERARAALGKEYRLLGFNCEHFVRHVLGLRCESPQLQGALAVTALAITASVLANQGD